MNNEQFDYVLEVLDDVRDSLDSLASSLRSIALYLWLPTILVVGALLLMFLMANK